MFTVLDVTISNRRDVLELFERLLDLLHLHKLTILRQCTRWIILTVFIFFLIYGVGTLALYNITPPNPYPAYSDLEANYGEWTAMVIPPINPEIIDEIKKDKPQNPKIFMNPDAVNPDEDPFIIIQDRSVNNELPILDTPIPTNVASEPTSSSSLGHSPTLTPVASLTPTSTPALILTITQTSTPPLSQSPTYTADPPTQTLPPTVTLAPPTPTLPPTNTADPPTPTLPPTDTADPPTPTLPPTNTADPPTPTSPPTSTDQPLVTICHISWFWWIPPRTIQVSQDRVDWHIGHGGAPHFLDTQKPMI